MPRKPTEPTHIGTVTRHRWRGKTEMDRVFLRETAKQWKDFNGRLAWRKKDGGEVGRQRIGCITDSGTTLEDVRPVTRADLRVYYVQLAELARARGKGAREHVARTAEQIDHLKVVLAEAKTNAAEWDHAYESAMMNVRKYEE